MLKTVRPLLLPLMFGLMTLPAMAGDLDGYEEVSRALFAGDRPRFEALLATWPDDIRTHLLHLAETAFPAEGDEDVGHA